MIDLFFLKTFVSVTQTGSFRIAAERNHITQPAVSQHIQILERKLGDRLLERHGKKIRLTTAGRVFLPYAESMLKTYEEAQLRVRETKQEFKGTLRVATIYSIGLYQLQPVIRKFLKKYPDIDLHLEYHHSAKIYEMIHNQTVDFGLVAYPQTKSGITCQGFLTDTLCLVQSKTHPVIKKGAVRLKELDGTKLITLAHGTPTGDAIRQFFTKNGIKPDIRHEYDHVELVKSAIFLGLGCGFIPKSAIKRELKDGSLEILNIRGSQIKRPLAVLCRNKKSLSKSALAFLQSILSSEQQSHEHALLV